MNINTFRSLNISQIIAVIALAVGMCFLTDASVLAAEEDAEDLEGTVWIMPAEFEMLTILKVKPDNTVEAGRWDEKEISWVGTYKNKRLELQNPYYVELSKDPIFRDSYERIEVTVDGSSMTGRYKFKINYPPTKMDDQITGYCINCWFDWSVAGLVGLGGIALFGGGILLRRWKRKPRETPVEKKPVRVKKKASEKKNDEEKKAEEEKKPCADRMAKFLSAVDDYEKHDRVISEILNTTRFIEEGRKTVSALSPEIAEAEDDYQSRLKYLLLLESGEQVTEWGGQALMWFGGLVSGGFSRIMSARAEKFSALAKKAVELAIPASTGVDAAAMEARAALAGNLSNLATTVGIAAAFVGSLAYFAPGARKSLEKMYQDILETRMKLKNFEMSLNIEKEKLADRTEDVAKADQQHRFNEILKLKQQMLPDCLDEYQKARDRIGGDRGDYLPPVRGLRPDWQETLEPEWRFTSDLLDRS